MNLDIVGRKIISCTFCDLCRSRRLAVPGEGPSNASIMLIGEAPGIEEDRTGRPFVGRAGKLLTYARDQSGRNREEIFITSIIKCRPPKNRKPKAFEIRSCLPYLWLQIKIIDPKLICLMGNVSASAVLNMQGVTAYPWTDLSEPLPYHIPSCCCSQK